MIKVHIMSQRSCGTTVCTLDILEVLANKLDPLVRTVDALRQTWDNPCSLAIGHVNLVK